MKSLDEFPGVIKNRPTERFYEKERDNWDRDAKALRSELQAAESSQREAEALREEMTKQAKRVAELEFEVARLTHAQQLEPPATPPQEGNTNGNP